jgi:anti-sigma factor RsiW
MSSTIDCHEANALLAAYGDGELDPVRSAAIERHLLGCAECAAKRDQLVALRARIRAEVPYHHAPAALRARVRAALERASPSTPRPLRPARDRWSWLGAGALAGCAATVFAWFIGTAALEWQAGNDVVREAVTNHTRATLGNRLTDVVSSDQHTVKPWLSARLDYSPPVRDFAAEGFPLIGGRLDYLDRHPVATLVYRYRQHTIDVFVRPLSGKIAPAQPSILAAQRGFNVAHATGSGMEWWAVSDVSPDVLEGFVGRVAGATPGGD